MTRRTALIFAVLVTACLAAITVNLYDLRQKVQPKPPVSAHSTAELKQAWPEGYEMFKLGGLTSEEFVAEAWRRAQAEKP